MIGIVITLWLTIPGLVHAEPKIPPWKRPYPLITEVRGHTPGHSEPTIKFIEREVR